MDVSIQQLSVRYLLYPILSITAGGGSHNKAAALYATTATCTYSGGPAEVTSDRQGGLSQGLYERWRISCRSTALYLRQ